MARKSRNHRYDLPTLELECMKALWALHDGTVREVRARLLPVRPLAYTTVMTVMDRLARKGVVEREKRGRAHLYRPTVAEEAMREHALGRLLENFFNGSRARLKEHLQGGAAWTKPTHSVPQPPPRQEVGPATPKRGSAPTETEIDPTLL